jgi:deoxycytidylate deaminase
MDYFGESTKSQLRRDKFTRKYLKMARELAKDNDACYSRLIGVVLVSNVNRIISVGYNGGVEGVPHADDQKYLAHLWNNLLTDQQRQYFEDEHDVQQINGSGCYSFASKFSGCGQCPRKLLGIKSGESLELCPCAHAERNALANANISGVSTLGSVMYCYCSVPCHECTVQICQSKVSRVVCLDNGFPDYSPSSRFLFEKSGVELVQVTEEWIDASE